MAPRVVPSSPLHPELLALLAGCRAAPADDTARLVLADWLEENSDSAGPDGPDDARARAELIRVQVELARPTNDTARVMQLRAAETRLLAAHAARWLGRLPLLLHIRRNPVSADRPFAFDPLRKYNPFRFARGLLTVDLNLGELEDAELGDWFASSRGAWVEEASVTVGGISTLERLRATAELRPYLGVSYAVGTTAVMTLQSGNPPPERLTENRCRRLLRSAKFAYVRKLTIYPAAAEAGFVRLLATAPNLSGVRWLEVKAPVGDEGAAFLAAAPLVNLSALDISRAGMTAEGLQLLANAPSLQRLVSLTAYRNPFGSEGIAALTASPLAERLNVLDLQNTGLGDAGVQSLVASPLLNRMHGPGLNLSMNPIGDAGARALAGCPHLARFTELLLRECHVSDAGAQALAESPYVGQLTYLDLFRNRIGNVGARALAEAPQLEGVRVLSLRDNRIGVPAAALLRARFGDRVKV